MMNLFHLIFHLQDTSNRNEFGHLIGTKCINNNFVTNLEVPASDIQSTTNQFFQANEDNQIVLTQNEALLNDDPLLSSSSIMYPSNRRKTYTSESYDYDYGNECEEVTSSTNFQCRWERCYQMYESQSCLVKHIEKCHVELKRGTFKYFIIYSKLTCGDFRR